MARVTEITASRSCKINLGDYQSTDHFVSMKMELDEGDSIGAVSKELATKVELAMAAQLMRAHKARGKKITWRQLSVNHGLPAVYNKDEQS